MSHQGGNKMEELLIEKEVLNIEYEFKKNNYSIKEKEYYLYARKKLAIASENEVMLKACEIVEEKLKEQSLGL